MKGYALHQKPASLAHLKKITPLNSELADFLKRLCIEDHFHEKWDFVKAGDISDFTLTKDAGATDFAVSKVNTAKIGGAAVGATGTTDNDGLSIIGGSWLKGDNLAYLHVHFQVDAITGLQLEIGLIDAVTDATLPVITDVDTPASGNGASDLVVVHMDTDQTLATMAMVVDGSTSGMTCRKTDFSPVLTPTAAETMCVRFCVDGDDATVYVNNERRYKEVLTSAIEGGVALRPWVYFRTRNTTSKAPQVELIEIMGRRTAA